MRLEINGIADGQRIPERFTCHGENISPWLRWYGFPEGTRSFALIVDDPDAPSGLYTHWLVYNIPSDVAQLAEGATSKSLLAIGILQGKNSSSHIGYFGPCPPPGKAHRYRFTLYALDFMPDLPAGANRESLNGAIKNHILAKTRITGLYQSN